MLPLEGVVVVEMGSSVAGPYAARVLCDMGAVVYKVEHPTGGDASRGWGPAGKDGVSPVFEAFNRAKRSVTVDMADGEQLTALREFILSRADVVVQNLKPGTAERFGLGAETLTQHNPELIYCNSGAFGPVGPLKDLPGYDPLMQGLTGLAEITGEADGGPCRVGSPVIDIGTGMWSAMGILALLTRRAQTGVGGIVDTCLYETGLAWMTLHSALYMATEELPVRSGLRGPMLAPNGGYRASDGILMIVCGTQGQFERLCQVIGAEALLEDERFATTQSRHLHHDDLAEMLEIVLGGNTRAHWAEKLNSVDIPNAPVTTINEMLVHPQTEASGMLQALPSNRGHVMGLPIRFDGERPHPEAGGSKLGAFNAQLHTRIDPGIDAAND